MKNLHLSPDRKQSQTVNLTLDQYRATELLSLEQTDEEVAQLIGVKTTTVEQWQQKPEFAAAVNMLRIASLDSSCDTEETERSEPITTLVDVVRFL